MRMTEEEFNAVLDTNLKGAFHMIRHLTKTFMKQRYGKIINISSVSGIVGNAGQANYSASKAGLIGLTKSVARELASRNICVNAVAPGFIRTDMTDKLPEAVQDNAVGQIPLKKSGKTGGCRTGGSVPGRKCLGLYHRPGAVRGRRYGNVKMVRNRKAE